MSDTPRESHGPEGAGADTEQFLKLLGAHERNLFTFVYALTLNLQDADEVMQRVRIQIWQQFEQYDPERPFDAWARAIAYYAVLTYRKEKSRQREFFTTRILEAVSDGFENLPERSNDRRDALLQCLGKLDQRKRELVNAYYSSAKQRTDSIAKEMAMTPNALRQSLFRIRKMLLECVERTLRAESHQ